MRSPAFTVSLALTWLSVGCGAEDIELAIPPADTATTDGDARDDGAVVVADGAESDALQAEGASSDVARADGATDGAARDALADAALTDGSGADRNVAADVLAADVDVGSVEADARRSEGGVLDNDDEDGEDGEIENEDGS